MELSKCETFQSTLTTSHVESNNNSNCKVFVGNVPFQCNQMEFAECFEKMQGYVKAEIVYKIGTSISRGFGFVTFSDPVTAQELLNKTIKFKDRELRFTQYMNTDNNQPEKHIVPISNESNKNLLLIKNTNDMKREDVYKFFSNFGNVGKHFIVTDHETGITKNCAIIEIIDKDVYECLLKLKEINNGTNVLEISKLKTKKVYKDKPITKNDLFNAFIAGKNIGMLEGMKKHTKIH